MRKLLITLVIMIAFVILIVVFLTSTNYTQLAIASLLYPLLAYLIFKCFPQRKQRPQVTQVIPAVSTNNKYYSQTETQLLNNVDTVDEYENESVDIKDIDKRAFLKIIGAAGLSYFIFSIFTRKAEALFFGRASDPGITFLQDVDGNKINPAEKQLTDGYQISEIDEGENTFCGFTNPKGSWFIMKEESQTGSFRYIKGESNFPDSWGNRENLNYGYFHQVFQS